MSNIFIDEPKTPITLYKRPNNRIVKVSLTKDPKALHYFVNVWVKDDDKMQVIHFRNIQYPPPPAQEVIGMTIPAAKKFLKEDDERAKHE